MIKEYLDEIAASMRNKGVKTVGSSKAMPCCPMMVILLGEDAKKQYLNLKRNFQNLWPSCDKDLRFVGVEEKNTELTYYEMKEENGEILEIQKDENTIVDIYSSLLNDTSCFYKKNNFYLFYFLETTNFNSPDEYSKWITRIADIKKYMGLNSTEVMDTLFLLLNEDVRKVESAREIRMQIVKHEHDAWDAMFILSNRKNDNSRLMDWSKCIQIATNIIAFINDDTTVKNTIYRDRRIYTAGYALDEKPVEEISKAVLSAMAEELRELEKEGSNEVVVLEPEKFGLTKSGTVEMLDAFVEEKCPKPITEQVLKSFPRKEPVKRDRLMNLSARELNTLTLNCLTVYLNNLMDDLVKEMDETPQTRAAFKSEFLNKISEEYDSNGILWLSEHMNEIKNIFDVDTSEEGSAMTFMRKEQPENGCGVGEYAKKYLKYEFSRRPENIEPFFNGIEELGHQIGEYFEDRKSFYNEAIVSNRGYDATLFRFYKNRVIEPFFIKNRDRISNEIGNIRSLEEIKKFRKTLIKQITDSDRIFGLPFQEEREERVIYENTQLNVKQVIADKLIGDNVEVYFRSSFGVSDPVVTVLILGDNNASLKDAIKSRSRSAVSFYGTSYSDGAESVRIYALDDAIICS